MVSFYFGFIVPVQFGIGDGELHSFFPSSCRYGLSRREMHGPMGGVASHEMGLGFLSDASFGIAFTGVADG